MNASVSCQPDRHETDQSSKLAQAKRIADAVLYEGYILYPYRPSAIKNRQRWTFGGLYPPAYSQAQGEPDSASTLTECLMEATRPGAPGATLNLKVRFLHLVQRVVGELASPVNRMPARSALNFRPVAALQVGGHSYYTWQEAVEREVSLDGLALTDLLNQPRRLDFAFPATEQIAPLRSPAGQIVGVILRQQRAINGLVEVTGAAPPPLFKLSLRVQNLTPLAEAAQKSRDEALLQSFVSTHSILSLENGRFLSLLDPPAEHQAVAAACRNRGTYPVLVGAEGDQDMLLSSPIILYDYPQLAPESPGDLFDGTEIDELLTLRILTLTDEEKAEMRQVDEQARALLDRTEALPAEELMRLHGTIRSLRTLTGE